MSQFNTPPSNQEQPAGRPQEGPRPVAERLRWTSQVLLAGGREADIEHNDDVYRLRITSQGKLILTK